MDDLQAQAKEKLLKAYLLSLDCIIRRLEYLKENVTEGMDPLLRSPFVESVPSQIDTLSRVAHHLGILDNLR